MKRLALILAALAVCMALAMPIEAGPDYKALYEAALQDAVTWQDKAFELSAEIARQKQLTEDALKLYEEAERDGDALRAEIANLTAAISERDAIIEVQAAQLKRLMGTERYVWLLGGILAGVAGGFVVGSPR
jgi:septal ring factor EnvC (AmiA/AmiB activator)